jgi:hypothetical protein
VHNGLLFAVGKPAEHPRLGKLVQGKKRRCHRGGSAARRGPETTHPCHGGHCQQSNRAGAAGKLFPHPTKGGRFEPKRLLPGRGGLVCRNGSPRHKPGSPARNSLMGAQTRREVLAKPRGAHARDGSLYKRQRLDPAVSLLGYYRKAARGLPADQRPVRRRAGSVDPLLPAGPPQ